MTSMTKRLLFGGTLMAAGLAPATQASVSFVGSRAALNGNNIIDWGQFGGAYANVPSGSAGLTSPSNVGFKVGQPGGGNLQRRDQLPPNYGGWNGCFSPGDRILWNNYGYSDTIHIDFAVPTDRVGANVQADFFGGFNGYISVFDTSNNLLGTFSAYGYASNFADGSAPFLGVQSTGFDIGSVDFRVASFTGINDLAINQTDVNYVPAPGAAGLLGIAGLVATRRRR